MEQKKAPFSHEIFEARDKHNSIYLKANYKTKNNVRSLYSYSLKLNGKEINNTSNHKTYLNMWKPFIDMCLNKNEVKRILIVGGGDQFLSNYILNNYPCDITLIDKNAFLYLQNNIAKILKAKPFYNSLNRNDLQKRKFIALDMDLREAYEDGVVNDEEFDLILVDLFKDTLEDKSGMYEPDIASIYYNVLKPKGSLIINHDFSFKEYNPKIRQTSDLLDLQKIRYDIKYYRDYMDSLNSLLCLTDHLYKNYIKISLYSKVLVEIDTDIYIGK